MRYSFCVILILLVTLCRAQNHTIRYEESEEDMVNPERGFYIATGTRASNFEKLDENLLRNYRNSDQRIHNASYSVKVSLIYRGYELDGFTNKPLSKSFLTNLQQDFDIVRKSGLKLILRFMYTNKSHNRGCADEICPPYGDAPKHIVLRHIQQLQPLLRKNADIIALLQQGFIGIWGENYFTDYFGDASSNGAGKILDSSWRNRNEVLKALLDAMPKTRMVQVRTPQMKQKFVYGPSASVNSLPLDSNMAFTASDASRVGFHNDCFLASEDDYGTYMDNGSSTQPKQQANKVLREYIEADTRYTCVGGETCDDAFSPQNDCAPAGYAEQEMRRMHYSYLNASYNNNVNNDWDSAGCMYNIKRQMGYRFVLRQLQIDPVAKIKAPINLRFIIENKGYATLYNPRPVVLILRNQQSGREFQIDLKLDPRKWYSGSHEIKSSIQLPGAVEAGEYDLFLAFPDAGSQIARRPEYSIQLANKDVWETKTGYNKLNAVLKIIK